MRTLRHPRTSVREIHLLGEERRDLAVFVIEQTIRSLTGRRGGCRARAFQQLTRLRNWFSEIYRVEIEDWADRGEWLSDFTCRAIATQGYLQHPDEWCEQWDHARGPPWSTRLERGCRLTRRTEEELRLAEEDRRRQWGEPLDQASADAADEEERADLYR